MSGCNAERPDAARTLHRVLAPTNDADLDGAEALGVAGPRIRRRLTGERARRWAEPHAQAVRHG
jgi:hypothetical protein